MRMWNIDPSKMCMRHLLGEHVEMHMFVGAINKGKSIQGYIDKGLVEVHNISNRHNELAFELLMRQTIRSPREDHVYYHKSPLPQFKSYRAGYIDVESNLRELSGRCADCRI